MKISHLSFALAVILSVLADFWLVYQRRFVQIGRIEYALYGTTFVTDTPQWTCEQDAFSHSIIPDQRNASGSKYGVEFEPWNSRPGPFWHDPIVNMKINTFSNILGLQSEYILVIGPCWIVPRGVRSGSSDWELLAIANDQGFGMASLNDGVSAQCYLNRTFVIDLDCWFTHADPRIDQFHVNINGSSMFFCESNLMVDADTYAGVKSLQGRESDMLPVGIPHLPPIVPCLGCK
ncbi:hypothetical protein RRF57_005823 [Xylaria bambusicola]|uniref:Uncharacterized protein n=1 Tax=Xylaria bambusicola TaxID=326684 RepID=A0AAN7UPD9_9PEZI